MSDIPLGTGEKRWGKRDGEKIVKMPLLLLSHRRTVIGLFANCYEKDEQVESAKERAFGLSFCLSSRIPQGAHGEGKMQSQPWDHLDSLISSLPRLVGSGSWFPNGVCLPIHRDNNNKKPLDGQKPGL